MKATAILLREAELKSSIASSIGTEVVNEFIQFWKLYDAIYYTIHSQITKLLYFAEVKTLDDVAYECNIDIKTLYRYRQKYMALFEELCKTFDA